MDKVNESTQPSSGGKRDPPTGTVLGDGTNTTGPAASPDINMRFAYPSTYSTFVVPTSIDPSNIRFNETAPPLLSPTPSSPCRVGAMNYISPMPATWSSQTSPAAVFATDRVLNRGAKISDPAVIDVAHARKHSNSNIENITGEQHAPRKGSSQHAHALRKDEDARVRKRRKAGNRQRSSPTSTPYAHRRRHTREYRQSHCAQMRRSQAAPPKFGHPFASNPDLPALANSGAASSATMDFATWDDHNAVNTRNRLYTWNEAAVPSTGMPANVGGNGGLQGGPSASPGRHAPYPSLLHNSEVTTGCIATAANRASRTQKDGESNTAVLNSSPVTPARTSSQLQKQQRNAPDHSGYLAYEGALSHLHHDLHMRVARRGHEEPSGLPRSTALSNGSSGDAHRTKGSSGGTGGTSRRSYRNHHCRHCGSNYEKHSTGNANEQEENNDDSWTSNSVESATTQATVDSFGCTIYYPIFRHGTFDQFDDLAHGRPIAAMRPPVFGAGAARNGGSKDDAPHGSLRDVPTTTDVPWDLRNVSGKEISKTFAFLSTRYFWFLVEYALRVTCIAMMIPAIIINLKLKHTPFISSTFALTSVVIAVGTNFGQSCVFFVQFIKGGCIWLPLATICSALKLNRYLGVWFVVYVVVLFLMAVFTEKTTRRMCLMLYNISMVSLLSGNESLVFPARVLVDWALGAAFALVATLIPYPMLATRFSEQITKIMFNNTATCFTGILSCFWAPNNTERSMSMVRIRSLVRTLDYHIEKFDSYDSYTFYEVLIYETSERREVRKEKVQLLLKLKMNLRAMERVINMVQERPQMIDLSERCLLLRDHLSVPMDDISRSMEALLWKMSQARNYDQLRTLSGYFEAVGRAMKRLQTEFDVGHRVLFYEHQDSIVLHDGRMEEFVPLMTFFVFSIVNFWTTLEEFETFIHRHKATSDWKESFKLVWNALLDPFLENAELFRSLCVRRGEPEVRVVIEAAKVSVAMLISVIFFYYVDSQALLLTGPSIIAFVSGTNPVEAVQAGAARLSGTLIGAVLGFFAASLCRTAVERVAALCVITFFMTFFRPGQKFGTICMYCNFVAVSGLAPTRQTADLTISRIQQNTFAIFIYCFISVAVFPVSPNHVLFNKRVSVMRSLNKTVQKMSALFYDAAQSYSDSRADILRGVKTGDEVLSIGLQENTNNRQDSFAALNGDSPMLVGQGIPNNPSAVKMKGLNNSDSAVPIARNNLNMIMPGAFTMSPRDTPVEDLFTDIFAMMDTMKTTTAVMPLAADEFQIIPHEYPLRASGDVHAALYRLCALVYTMTCAWKTMRKKGYFTTDMLHILHSLAPIANDIARCLDRFTHVMEFYVRFPSSGLSSELTKGVMQLRALCVELSARKERYLMAVIRQTMIRKRIRDDDSADTEEEVGSKSSTCGSHNGSSGSGAGERDRGGRDHPSTWRPHKENWSSRSEQKRSGRRRIRKPGSCIGSGPHRRAASSGSRKRHRGLSHNDPASRENMNGLAERTHVRDDNRLNRSQVRFTAPFFNVLPSRDNNAQSGELTSSASTFKDSVMPRIDSRDETQPHLTAPVPGDSSWLPVPHSVLPEMPSQWQPQEQAMDQYQRTYDLDDDSVTNTSARARADGAGRVTKATRVLDPAVFSPPSPVDVQLDDDTRENAPNNRRDGSSKGSHHRRHATASMAAPTCPTSGTAHQPHSGHSSPHTNQRHLHYRSSLHPQRLVAHEGSPPINKSAVLKRADRLRKNIRGVRRYTTVGAVPRQHSNAKMRTYGANYTNIAATHKSAAIASRIKAHHRSSRPRRRSNPRSLHQHNYERSYNSVHDDEEEESERNQDRNVDRHGRSRRAPLWKMSNPDPDGNIPYGSQEGDLALLGLSNRREDVYKPDALRSNGPCTSDGVCKDDPQQQQASWAQHSGAVSLPLFNREGASDWRHCRSQDRITLDQSSSKDYGENKKCYLSSEDWGSFSYSSSSFYRSDESRCSEYGSSSNGTYKDDGFSSSPSLAWFNESFTMPFTVQDAEGLHAFTLSLELFGKELRRALYGLEEMLQSL